MDWRDRARERVCMDGGRDRGRECVCIGQSKGEIKRPSLLPLLLVTITLVYQSFMRCHAFPDMPEYFR